ncbi:MAG: glycosyltransferase family A protein [Blastocatellia bacterium]|nr:glycosyltransferase family A protein [Blastocatellia bacterium]
MTDPMHNPEISVIIPTYNRARLLPRSLQSVLSQTCDRYEVIVADDGSSDGTDEVLAQWQERFGERMRTLRLEHAGVACARNAGLAASRGRWVAFLDSDDEWLPNHLETTLAAFQRGPAPGLVVTDHYIQSDQLIRTRVELGEREEEAVRRIILRKAVLLTTVVAIDRRVYEQLDGFDAALQGTEDWEYWVRIAIDFPVIHVPEATAIIHQHSENHSGNPEKAERQLAAAARAISRQRIAKYCTGSQVAARALLDSAEFYSWNGRTWKTLRQLFRAGSAAPGQLLTRDALRIFARAALPLSAYRGMRDLVWRKLRHRGFSER